MGKRYHLITYILAAVLIVSCVVFSACGRERTSDNADVETAEVQEQAVEETLDAKDTAAKDEAAAETAENKKAAEDKAAKEKSDKAAKEKADKEKSDKEKKAKKDSSKSSKDSNSNSSAGSSSSKSGSSGSAPAEKKKVWVEPVTETRTVTLDTGTRYCNGPRSNGGCGASWHGTKDGTYDKWYDHWQDYVKKRTAEEAEKGNTYVCDHIHDDSRWVPDTKSETVVVQEGYWKEVD